jgi:septum formation protein
MKIILGSSSKGRAQVLKNLGFEFEVKPANIDEKAIRTGDFRQLPLLVARAKNEALKAQIKEPAILITGDSVVIWKDALREKPVNVDEAREFLRGYADGPAELVSAVVVTNLETGKSMEGVESGKIYFHKFPETVIEDLIEHGAIMHAAGAFLAEMEIFKKYTVHMEGNMDTIMGLPGELTKKLIEQIQ